MADVSLEEIRSRLETILPAIKERFGVGKLWVVGSRSRGDHRLESDLDLVVQFERRGISLLGFCELEAILSDDLGLKVDLVEEGAMPPVVAEDIARDAI